MVQLYCNTFSYGGGGEGGLQSLKYKFVTLRGNLTEYIKGLIWGRIS